MIQPCEHHLHLLSFWGSLGDTLSLSPSSCSPPSHLMPDDYISLDDADWEVIADDWWHTPLSLAPCPLSWIDREPHQSRLPRRPEIAARNSHYWHEFLLRIVKNVRGAKVCYCGHCQGDCNATEEFGVHGDQDLNLELVGTKMVLDMVDELERAVGIAMPGHHAAEAADIAVLARRVSLLLGDAVPIENPEGFWNEYTASVLDGHRIAPRDAVIFRPDICADPPPADSITSILDLELDPPRKKSSRFSREVIDLTDSEQSVASEALPATPKPLPIFASNPEDDGRATGTLMAPYLNYPKSDSLTGTAPKFHIPRIPSSPLISYSSGSPPTSDELLTESSHTRCSSLPPGGDLHKEDYDLEFVSESTPSEDAEIPHFLVTSSDRLMRQHSRTREIVDRLRSAAVPRGRARASSTNGNGSPSAPAKNRQVGLNNATVKQLFQKGSDGWIRLADDVELPTAKAKNPPGQTDGSRNPTEDSEPSDSEEVTFTALVPRSTRDSSKRKPPVQSKHTRRGSGWVEGSSAATIAHTAAAPPRRGHGHRLSQSVQLAAPAAVGTFTFPPPAFYPFPAHPLPQFAPAPLMSFGQPPPYRGYPPRAGYPLTSSLPFVGALPHQHQHHHHQIPHQHLYPHQLHRAAFANVPVITGSTGIRHAQW
ncbi:hypothetical protein BJY52DRAFT_669703 [Lactarius psammicola]|nr:hypothetical protein BJY52DRAFT_669703 [Lactarius psammicola]